MKKILVLSCLLISTLSAFAINLSLSDGDFDMNANVTREDNNLRMQYKIKGMNSVSNITEIPEDQKQAISQVGDVNFDILASCSESKVKVLPGLNNTPSRSVTNGLAIFFFTLGFPCT